MPARPLQDRSLGLSKHQPTPERIPVEQGVHQPAGRALWTPSFTQAVSGGHRSLLEVLGLYQLIHDSELEGPPRRNALAGEDDVEGRSSADQPGQALAAAGRGQDADLHLGLTQDCLGMIGSDAIGAGRRRRTWTRISRYTRT